MTDTKGTIVYANERFARISKYEKHELIGQNHRILNSGEHSAAFFRAMYRTIAKGKVWRGELCNRAKDGSLYWVDTWIIPALGKSGKVVGYISIRVDITARKAGGSRAGRARGRAQAPERRHRPYDAA